MKRFVKTLADAFLLFWRGVDQARRLVVNVLFLILLAALISWLLADGTPKVPETTALVVAPYGDLVEQLSADPDQRAILALLDERQPETLMRTMIEAIEAAQDDDRVRVLLLDLSRMGGAGLSKLQTLRATIGRFKESGKTVIAASDFYTQSQYYLASCADEIYMHPMGIAMVTGYGSYRNYYKEALDRLDVDWHVFRVGEYKSAVEPFIRNDMSPEARESRQRWLSILWQSYREDVEAARGLEAGALDLYASRFAELLAEHEGDAGALAQAVGLVDHLSHRDEVRQRLIELVGEDDDGHSFRQIDHRSYWRAVKKPGEKSDNVVAVVVARGGIYDGQRSPGSTGGDSTAQLIRRARESEDVKALVLRVDSPGGSAFASEIIRREVELMQEAGKPVIASMSSVAASGGYLISMSADEIWAMPTTITGSIGIYAMLPTFPRTLEKLGVHNDGTGTGVLAGTLRPDRALPDEAAQALELMIEQGYREFIQGVAAGRNKTEEEVDSIARGRVWAGIEAHNLGLVDHLGGLEEAIGAASARAELGDDYRISYIEQEQGWLDRILDRLVARASEALGPNPGFETPVVDDLAEDLFALSRFEDPQGVYAYCFCEPN